jgi:hypothetical protein
MSGLQGEVSLPLLPDLKLHQLRDLLGALPGRIRVFALEVLVEGGFPLSIPAYLTPSFRSFDPSLTKLRLSGSPMCG